MKKTYKIEERKYSDGSSMFYPKVHDWWHGWRYYRSWVTTDWVECPPRVWFKKLDDAVKFLDNERNCSKMGMAEKPYLVGVEEHEVKLEKEERCTQ